MNGPAEILRSDPGPLDLDPGRLMEGRVEGYRQGARPVSRRVFLFGILALVAFGGLLTRLAGLQLAEGDYYRSLADENRVRRLAVRAPRGIIYDRRGIQLVENIPNQRLAVIPADLPRGTRRGQVLDHVQRAVGISRAETEKVVADHATEPFEPAIVRRELTPEQALVLQEQAPEMPGIRVEVVPERRYLDPELIAHLAGYVGPLADRAEYDRLQSRGYRISDVIGKEGIERALETQLRGSYGEREVETDAKGQVVKELAREPERPGDDVRLSIDIGFQRALAEYLQGEMDSVRRSAGAGHATAGSAIVMDPRDGQVLAMVSLPSYDINKFAHGISEQDYQGLLNDPGKPLVDRAFRGEYPPGSVFKMVTAAAALQEKKLNPSTIVNCKGFIDRFGYRFYCYKHDGHGDLDLAGAMAQSCDVYFYTAAEAVGDEVLAQYARAFGFGQETGIEIGPERTGIAPDRQYKAATLRALNRPPEPWYIGDTLHSGIGQGYVLVTPLQIARMTSTVANGGRLHTPSLIRSLGTPGQTLHPRPPGLERQVPVAPELLAAVRQGMRQSVVSGTSFMFRDKPWEVAGKTGTAEYGTHPDEKGNLPTHAWFTCFAPFAAPEVAVTVFIEGGGEGSVHAQPVAVRALQYYFDNRDGIRS